MFDHLDRFALVILLQYDDRTLETRLRDPHRDNIFGKVGETVAWSRWWRKYVETELTARNAHTVDAHQPLEQVVEATLAHCAAHGYTISSSPAV